MIYGDGIASKYSVIVDGRRQELIAAGIPDQQRIQEMSSFAQMIKHSKRDQFEEWYSLYFDTVKPPTRKKNK